MDIELKNNAPGILEETKIDDGFFILKFQNDTPENKSLVREIGSDFIQFHFCLKGAVKFNFNNGSYAINLTEENSLLLYNPQLDLPMNVEMEKDSWLITLIISIKKFHSLFSREADFIPFLGEGNRDKKYYTDAVISPSMAVVLNQIMNYSLHKSIKLLYFRGKAYELISLYFNKPEDVNIEQCPFLVDEENVLKIRKAKEIVIARMAEPPTLQELSNEIGLSLKKLKDGFKQIYGEPVYAFLFDYKMEVARKLLASRSYNVNEVGLKVGYSTASHFIAAFKKKFGTTPKKYVTSLN
ncbi:helix-turn-helix transcriptional regulator [Aquimarina pacifica]|uniref:helix-turn-helix transcriptional regulator n=1 Tax=Aquimarina pacifica TaxID=1296415 RepID=UPI0004729787|nr:AraC family transcriptional regulator [Aquimarina pacifica]